MAGNSFGEIFRVTTFGESHGEALGTIIDGCPAGLLISEEDIQHELDRRKPNASQGASATSRREPDKVRILSGIFEGKTEGTPIAMIIENTTQRSGDYGNLQTTFRPGHGDFTYFSKYGFRDYRGGGRSSGRETAARVAAGAVAKKLIENFGIKTTAYTIKAGGIACDKRDLSVIEKNSLRACDMEAAIKMEEQISELRKKGDSTGGVVECVISGMMAGLGEPVFDKLDAELAKAIISIGAVKGIEFGAGFNAADMTGSQNNDAIRYDEKITFLSNNAGGILAGISSGQDIIFRAAIKPVPSIFQEQKTVCYKDGTFENADLTIQGRHDACLCPRIIPVIEAMSAIVIADMILRNRSNKI